MIDGQGNEAIHWSEHGLIISSDGTNGEEVDVIPPSCLLMMECSHPNAKERIQRMKIPMESWVGSFKDVLESIKIH